MSLIARVNVASVGDVLVLQSNCVCVCVCCDVVQHWPRTAAARVVLWTRLSHKKTSAKFSVATAREVRSQRGPGARWGKGKAAQWVTGNGNWNKSWSQETAQHTLRRLKNPFPTVDTCRVVPRPEVKSRLCCRARAPMPHAPMPHGPLLLSVLRPRSLSPQSHFDGVVRKRKSRGRMRSKQREMKVMRRILKPHGACLAGRGPLPLPPTFFSLRYARYSHSCLHRPRGKRCA